MFMLYHKLISARTSLLLCRLRNCSIEASGGENRAPVYERKEAIQSVADVEFPSVEPVTIDHDIYDDSIHLSNCSNLFHCPVMIDSRLVCGNAC